MGSNTKKHQWRYRLLRWLIQRILSIPYRLHCFDEQMIPTQGHVLLLGNHLSRIDIALLIAASPRPIQFILHPNDSPPPLLQPLLSWAGFPPITSSNKASPSDSTILCLFPEQTPTLNGQLAPFTFPFDTLLQSAGTSVIPFYLHGLWGSRFSAHTHPTRTTWFKRRSVQLHFGKPHQDTLSNQQARRLIERLGWQAWQQSSQSYPSLQQRWIAQSKRMGLRTVLTDWISGDQFSGIKLLIAATLIARRIERQSSNSRIGVLLPTTAAGVITNLAILLRGRTIVNLNYSASDEAISDAIALSGVDTIYSSTRFLQKLEEKGRDLRPILEKVTLVELESLKGEITSRERMTTALQVLLTPASLLTRQLAAPSKPEEIAAILFSSGSEGRPKGIPLSHRNIMGNIQQIIHALQPNLGRSQPDIMMGSLPLFHSFGLTATTLMPLLEGIPLVTAPDPTDTQSVVAAIEKYRTTLYVGTPTFLQWMSRNNKIKAEQLAPLRLVISGAEPLKPAVREAFEEKFHKTIYEGYGATEMSPAITVNLPDVLNTEGELVQQGNQPGAVGRPFPGTLIKIVDRETLEPLHPNEDGLILTAGVQQMEGYLPSNQTPAPPFIDLFGIRWYASGDKGHIDENGFLTIVDRYARFAKIGGEMVSLTATEIQIKQQIDAIHEVAAVAIPDLKKGEKIILFYCGALEPRELAQQIRSSTISPIMVPAQNIAIDEIPLLGSGKRNYGLMKQWALEL